MIPKISRKSFKISSLKAKELKKIGHLIKEHRKRKPLPSKADEVRPRGRSGYQHAREKENIKMVARNCNFAKQVDCWDFPGWNLDGRKTFYLIQPGGNMTRRITEERRPQVWPRFSCVTKLQHWKWRNLTGQVSKSGLCTGSWICGTFQRDCQVMGTT